MKDDMKVFLTGATGYIGGDVLKAVVDAFPYATISCLVRSTQSGDLVSKMYPKVTLVYGDLDDSDLLTLEARCADVVINCANNGHAGAAAALAKGLAAHPEASPGYLLHTGGALLLAYHDIKEGRYGFSNDLHYDDTDEGLSEVMSFPDEAPHRVVDKLVLGAGTKHLATMRTAIICPAMIYGLGRGPGNTRSVQLPELCRATLTQGCGIQVGEGRASWSNVYIRDLSNLFVLLLQVAADDLEDYYWSSSSEFTFDRDLTRSAATWGERGYYFAMTAWCSWGQVARSVASTAYEMGLIDSNEVKSLTPEKANKLWESAALLWGTNAKCESIRATKLLRWRRTGNLDAEIKSTILREVERIKDEENSSLIRKQRRVTFNDEVEMIGMNEGLIVEEKWVSEMTPQHRQLPSARGFWDPDEKKTRLAFLLCLVLFAVAITTPWAWHRCMIKVPEE